MTRGPFSMPGGVAGVTLVQVLALIPPSAVAAFATPEGYGIHVAWALATALIWETLFAAIGKRGYSFHGVTTALVVIVLIPADLPIWQLVVMLSLGVILGELVFGGRGFGFLNPATVTLSLLVFSFPQVQLVPSTAALAIATLPGAALLLLLGLISGRVVLSTLAGTAAILALIGLPLDGVTIGSALTFGIVFLICDPTAAAATNPGRWVYGLLAGALVVLFSASGDLSSEAVVFASLLASLFAPLIDHLVVLADARRRKVAHV